MASLGMQGPFALTPTGINEAVTKVSAGNYALGSYSDRNFYVNYVGRSDEDVNRRLHRWTGSKYSRFKFSYASSAKAAFEKECRNYHGFGGADKLDNAAHPDRPSSTNWKCPVCTIFD